MHHLKIFSAEEEIRTPEPVRALVFKTSAITALPPRHPDIFGNYFLARKLFYGKVSGLAVQVGIERSDFCTVGPRILQLQAIREAQGAF